MNQQNTSATPISDPLSIFKNIDDLIESMNYMKYQFFIDFPKSLPSKNIIKDLENKITELQGHKSGGLHIPYDIFGFSINATNLDQNLTFCHSIISCLHTVNYLLYYLNFMEKNESYKPYTASNYIEDRAPVTIPGGFFLSLIDTNDIRKIISQPIDHQTYSEKFHRFNKSAKQYAMFVLGKKELHKENDYTIPKYNFNFYNYIYSHSDIWQSLQSNYIKTQKIVPTRFEKFIKKYKNFCNASQFKPSEKYSSDSKMEKAIKTDHLLLQYQLERYFNAHLLDHLFASLPNDAPKNCRELWKRFMALPNVFTRNQLVDIAVCTLEENDPYDSYKNMALSLDKMYEAMGSRGGKREIYPIHDKTVRNAVWIDTVSFGLAYLSKVYFPFYEKYTFLYLYSTFYHTSEKEKKEEKIKDALKNMKSILFEICSNLDYSLSEYNDSTPCQHQTQYLDAINSLINQKDYRSFFQTTYSKEYFGVLNNIPHNYSLEDNTNDLYSFHQLMLEYKIRTIITSDDIVNADKE